MTCAAVLPSDGAMDERAALAAAVNRLCGRRPLSVERRKGGGNNRLYRIVASDGALALKHYGPPSLDPGGDRLRREFGALSFLAGHGVSVAPAPVAADLDQRLGLYQWIDGVPPGRIPSEREPADIAALCDFAVSLQRLRAADGAAELPAAAEACLSVGELTEQISRRLKALSAAASDDDALAAFLADGVVPALLAAERRASDIARAEGLDCETALPAAQRILSPSDFGFHNMLRRPDGARVFLDFEYFGWDDPAKLLCDTLWHPAYRLAPQEQAAWLNATTTALIPSDPALPARLCMQSPLYGLRWCMIILNEFLPERWLRRRQAGAGEDWAAAKAGQLAKARAWLSEVRRVLASPAATPASDFIPFHLPPLTAPV